MDNSIFWIKRRVVRCESNDVGKESVAYIFRIEELAKQETSKQSSATFMFDLVFDREDGCDIFL
jgi:hypothetical protein